MMKILTKPFMLLLMATPFVSMILILSALWGLVGKTTYIDVNTVATRSKSDSKIGNVLVKETQNAEACAKTGPTPEADFDTDNNPASENKPLKGKIDWDHVV